MEDAFPGVVKGFSAWLEPESLHYHAGIVRVRALWGYMMQREGTPDIGGWDCYALDPAGTILEADIAQGEGNHHNVAFFAGGEGLYNLVLENSAGIYCRLPGGGWSRGDAGENPGALECSRFIQRSRLPVPVGHHVHGPLGGVCPGGLDVFSREFREYRPGDGIVINVYYRGRPLAGADLKATCHLFTGSGYPWQGKTGEDGEVYFTFPEKGHWMFTCTFEDRDDGVPGRFSKTVHTANFVVSGVR